MAKIFRNYTTLAEYEADTNKPVNTVCFIKDTKVIYVDGIQYSYKQLDYLPPAISEAEALEYMGKIVKNAKEIGLIYINPLPYIYWVGPSNTISINGSSYTAEPDKITIGDKEYYQLKLNKYLNNSLYQLFMNNTFTNLTFKDVDTSKITNMEQMFDGCTNLASLDVSNFDTSNVTSMMKMFNGCNALTSLNVSNFDTRNVTDMSGMFQDCTALISLDLSNFNILNVTNMPYMFIRCNSLTSLDLSGWDTSNVTNMYGMFYNCSSLTSLDLSTFDTSKVTDMNNMFTHCNALKTIRMVGCSQTTIDKIKAQLATDGITDCTIVTE